MRLLPFALSLCLAVLACSQEKPASKDTAAADSSGLTTTPSPEVATRSTPPASTISIDSSLFARSVRRHFPGEIVRSTKTKGGMGGIVFREPTDKAYFTVDDRINRVFAIESMKLFRDVPDLDALQMVIEYQKIEQQVEVTRAEAEKFYGMKFRGISEADWQVNFVDLFDIPGSRKTFVKSFTGKRTEL